MTLAKIVVRYQLSQAFFQEASLPVAYSVDRHDGMTAGYLAWLLQKVGKPDIAEPLARHAIADTTLSAPAIGTLALIDQHDPALAGPLARNAAAMGWRDPQLQIWLARAALRSGDNTAAANHADAAARIQGIDPDVRALIDEMAQHPDARAAIAARLAQGPQWRIPYFLDYRPPLGNLDARAALLHALAGSAIPPQLREIGLLTMISKASLGPAHAYDQWRTILRPDIDGVVYDPHFSRADSDRDVRSAFDWSLVSTVGVTSDVTHDGGQTSLHVITDGTPAGPITSQLVRIAPGHHSLQVTARFATPVAASAYRWSLFCADATGPTKPIEPDDGVATGAADFRFTVPADGHCPMQVLLLNAQQASTLGSAEAWFSDIHIG